MTLVSAAVRHPHQLPEHLATKAPSLHCCLLYDSRMEHDCIRLLTGTAGAWCFSSRCQAASGWHVWPWPEPLCKPSQLLTPSFAGPTVSVQKLLHEEEEQLYGTRPQQLSRAASGAASGTRDAAPTK
jgi:hypothetical protein